MISKLLQVSKHPLTKSLILCFSVGFTLSSCDDLPKQEDVANNNDEIVIEQKITNEVVEEKTIEKKVYVPEENIRSFIKNNEKAFEQYNYLLQTLSNRDSIKTIEEVNLALASRDKLVSLLMSDNRLYEFMETGLTEDTYNEFEKLGIEIVEAEGMFFELGKAPLLTDLIEKLANEPDLLKNQIENLYSASRGSEYPFLDLEEQLKIIPLVEKLITKYPQNQYNSKALEILKEALTPLVDVHLVKSNQVNNHIVGGLYVEAYPNQTDISYHKKFASEDTTRFSKVVKNILGSISTIDYSFEKIYYIEVPEIITDSTFANQQKFEEFQNLPDVVKELNGVLTYLWLGLDVPHVLNLGNNTKSIVVYRFYDELAPAEKSLEEIKKIIPSAKLVEYQPEK
ncbi:hypothetical protein MY04_4344 [Flammeovirga sp. MY04]|uniref:hypothetical protein n=1 Tax=Flammeovirga sp. MY04 TaxID=1191459 RepID=UPI0008062552|nr:hypothetical protein [Flammeovirga sp. MY04]ANQ51684.1 hypothetical protein MY04_4344 [Flammeovirga sp. MY04]